VRWPARVTTRRTCSASTTNSWPNSDSVSRPWRCERHQSCLVRPRRTGSRPSPRTATPP
jgi:hypothetical protein